MMIIGYINGHRIYEDNLKKEVLTTEKVTSITFVPDVRRALFIPFKKRLVFVTLRIA
ncbi:hypothetical protein WN48_09570 [Eufriesea mexicana]|uniref:Uncharacterized protein n=1 Tax=Eufriesea mexicana TaxID=516756 RepID=A0A310SE95_9HYME|nr:hypothetical protein WN48_09570 [Eufriesea mexicana]